MTALQKLKQHPFFSQWLILGIALVVFGSAIGYNIFDEYQRTRNREEERLLASTRIIQENIIQNLIATRDVLVGLRQQIPKGRADKDRIARLKALSDAIPGVRTLSVIDASGINRASDRMELIGKNFSQREYFKVPQQQPDKSILYISPPFRTILGVFTINAGVIIPGPNGEFAGVVTATLDPSYFGPLLDSVLYTPDMRTSIIHWDGDVFMIRPAQIDIAGKSLAQPSAFFTLHKDSGLSNNVFTGTTAATGEGRMVTFYTAKSKELKLDKPLIITASRDAGEIYKGWLHDALIQGGLFGLLAIASILSLYTFQRKQLTLQQQAAKSAADLRESEERFRSFVENANDIVYSLTPNGIFTYVSPHWKEVLGHDIQEVEGHSFEIFVHPDDLPLYRAFLQQTIMTGEKQAGVEYRVLHKNGTWRWHTSNASPINIADGKNVLFMGIARDITDRRQAEGEREKLISELQDALNSIKTLSGLVPICASCKKIRDDQGYWKQLESYLSDHSTAVFSHGYCPECAEKLKEEATDFLNNNSTK
jgi:PAS domain S-box-containing protein